MRSGKVSKKVGQREQLILALLQQPSLEKAAASIGISTVTAWRISKTKEFKEEYRNARWEASSQSLARLQQASGAAVSALLKMMIDRPLRRRAACAPPTVSWITPAGPRRSKTSMPGLRNWSAQRIRRRGPRRRMTSLSTPEVMSSCGRDQDLAR